MDLDSLWFDVEESVVAAPAVSREQVLPFGNLSWENFERLCFRLAHRDGDVLDGRLYGVQGQNQGGIDLYVRRANGDYATWQCKRYREITASQLEAAVTRFLEGEWASRTKLFRLAVAPSLNPTELAEEVEAQRLRCEALDIAFEALDRERLSVMLKAHPDLVDDFFGRSWVEAFNGAEVASSLAGRRLTRDQRIQAGRSILTLYATHFQTVDGGIPAAAGAFRGAVPRLQVFDRYVEPEIELIETFIELERASGEPPDGEIEDVHGGRPSPGFRKREIRTKLLLSAGLAGSARFLLVGGAGFGKSAALRVVIHSLLSGDSRFPALAKVWGRRLPVLLPFGFLTRHFAESETPTIESALDAWLKVLGAKDSVLALLQVMLVDERLLLLVDGLDEWQNREAAVSALTALNVYIQTRDLPLVATARPLGFELIGDLGTDWKRASLLPLTANQQREFAAYWFRHFHQAGASHDEIALTQAIERDAAAFTEELSTEVSWSELGSVPLLLSVMIYLRLTGRVLPRSRLSALDELVKALLDEQPRRRAQASMQRSDQSATRSRTIRRGIEYLAYCIHQEPSSQLISNERAMALLRAFFHEQLELHLQDADQTAERVLALGQHEFGLLVAPQDLHVGLLHRVFQEYLAAKYLAQEPLSSVQAYCAGNGHRAPWHEVTLFLLQLLQRQSDVDGLIDELRKPLISGFDSPLQQILLGRIAVSEANCSQGKMQDLLGQVFSWIETGLWMPLRLSLVREVVIGLESEYVGNLIGSRIAKWFPGKLRWFFGTVVETARQPTSTTTSDLRVALYNCEGSFEYREVSKALSSRASENPELADEFLDVLRGAGSVDLMAAALHALALGWPEHPKLPELLEAASASPAEELQKVAILARARRGDRSDELLVSLVALCSEWGRSWPWDDDVVKALVAGWPNNSELKIAALASVGEVRSSRSWSYKCAMNYLILGFPGDDEVAMMLGDQLQGDVNYLSTILPQAEADLVAGFSGHPLIVPAAEAWLETTHTNYRPVEVSVVARLGNTAKCRQSLLDWLRRGEGTPAWIISALLEMGEPDDPEFLAVLSEYIADEKRCAESAKWLSLVIQDRGVLAESLRRILREAHVFQSSAALEAIVQSEGGASPDVWDIVKARLENDDEGHYWRLGCGRLMKVWPEEPLIRNLAINSVWDDDIWRGDFYAAYGRDSEIRPLLDQPLRALHKDLRLEVARSIEPLARRGVPSAVSIVAQFWHEPNQEARTVAARAYAMAKARFGTGTEELVQMLCAEFTRDWWRPGSPQLAAAAALLDLGRADLISTQLVNGKELEFDVRTSSGVNWEFIGSAVEHWGDLRGAMPDVWSRFGNSALLASELLKAGEIEASTSPARIFEESITNGEQLEVERIRFLISLHGRSVHLRNMFLARFEDFVSRFRNSIAADEESAYREMANYLGDHFQGDVEIGETLDKLADRSLVSGISLVALARGWRGSPRIAAMITDLPNLIESRTPAVACLFASQADAPLFTNYLFRYFDGIEDFRFAQRREAVSAMRVRLQTDADARRLVFQELLTEEKASTLIAVAKILAPSMRDDSEFRSLISGKLDTFQQSSGTIAPLAFDVFSNGVRSVVCSLLEAAYVQR